jgi:1,4-alpha-glucan branching enzyme
MGWMNDFLFYIKNDPLFRKNHHNRLTFGMAYHYSENFVLVLSHDEVVHEKSSMIGKMPGDDWQRFANLRVAYGFMYGHPGKKLLFMGGEFGQYHEWCEAKSLDWHLLQYPEHQHMQTYVKELNRFYLENEALWKEDFDPHGFQWIECDDKDSSIVSFIRRSEEKEIYCICNFTPVAHFDFRMGVPTEGKYKEIFNSDSAVFGGSGVENTEEMLSEETPWNHFSQSITLNVPPLGMIVLEQEKETNLK